MTGLETQSNSDIMCADWAHRKVVPLKALPYGLDSVYNLRIRLQVGVQGQGPRLELARILNLAVVCRHPTFAWPLLIWFKPDSPLSCETYTPPLPEPMDLSWQVQSAKNTRKIEWWNSLDCIMIKPVDHPPKSFTTHHPCTTAVSLYALESHYKDLDHTQIMQIQPFQ